MKKKALSIILTLSLCLGTLPATVLAADDIDAYDVWVGGVQITSANAHNVLGGADEEPIVSYDADSNTLTLSDTDITGGYEYEAGCFTGIYSDGELVRP